MKATPGTNWQIMLADLSIILFLMTFSALAHHHAAPKTAVAEVRAGPPAPPQIADPVAIWRAGGGAPTLENWLKTQAPDPRLRINVYGGYIPGRKEAILTEAAKLVSEPVLAGRDVRLIVEPADQDFVTVTLSFDRT